MSSAVRLWPVLLILILSAAAVADQILADRMPDNTLRNFRVAADDDSLRPWDWQAAETVRLNAMPPRDAHPPFQFSQTALDGSLKVGDVVPDQAATEAAVLARACAVQAELSAAVELRVELVAAGRQTGAVDAIIATLTAERGSLLGRLP